MSHITGNMNHITGNMTGVLIKGGNLDTVTCIKGTWYISGRVKI